MYRYLYTLALLCQASRVFSDTNYRLNTPIRPKAYSIAITPYFETNDDNEFTFDGEVDITFTTVNQTRQIKLHSEDLLFNSTNIQVFNGSNILQLNLSNSLQFDTKYTFAYINLQNDLQVGVEYSLKISYRGPIREDLYGFYRSYYIERGVKKWLGATQMEATHARKVFPCFDEPELKATFSLSIDRPPNYEPSLANTKLQTVVELNNGYIREIFHPSPIMSTYLVAFLVSEFSEIERLNGTKEIGIYTRPEASNQTDYALDFASKVVDALGEYFGIDYYYNDAYLKLKHIAVPDFGAGAMENWGCITYRESLLLYVPEVSTPYYKYRVAQIVAHETTHMWFGNLVTCHWWSNTWLNEGFANYFQDFITASVDPDVSSANILVIGSLYDAYNADSSPTSPPISNDNVNSPSEISGHFGTVTYQKAGAVIRMMHHWIGDEGFRLGLHNYLETNKFTSGYPEKMYSALNFGVQNTSSLAIYPDTDITEVMSSWINQAGYPILHVDIDYTTDKVVLTQKRFYQNAAYSSNETYNIPVTYTTGLNPSFQNTKPLMVMKNKTHEFTITGIHEDRRWVIFNIQETGLYRVNYDDETWKLIAQALKGSDREQIHHLNRAKIVNDLFAFLFADEVKFNLLQDVLEFMSTETDYSVWYAAITGLKNLRNRYLGNDALADIDAYALKVLQSGIDSLGYSVGPNETFETLRNRMQILDLACKLGHEGCIDNAVSLYRGLKEDAIEITPSLRPLAYCNGLRFGDSEDYDFLWNRMATTNYASEANVIADALGCTSDEDKLKSYLVSMDEENSPIRSHDLTVPLKSVLSNYTHNSLVLDELRKNFTYWAEIYSTSIDTVLMAVASSLHTENEFTEFESFLSFLASCNECSDEVKVEASNSLVQSRALTNWAESHKEEILNTLRSHGATLTPSMMLVVLLAVALESIVFC